MCHTQNRELNWKQSLPIPGVDSGFPGGEGVPAPKGNANILFGEQFLHKNKPTRMHSSRKPSQGGGVGILSRGVSAQVGCLPWEVSAGGVVCQGGVWPADQVGCLPGSVCYGASGQGVSAWGCLPRGVSARMCLPRGVSAQRGGDVFLGVSAQRGVSTCGVSHLSTDRRLWKHQLFTNTVADDKKWAERDTSKICSYVTVLGYPPLPAWSLSDSRQAREGLDTDIMPFHKWLNILQMAAPGAAIWLHLAMGVSTCTGAMHVCPTKIFYKSGAHRTSGLTFG